MVRIGPSPKLYHKNLTVMLTLGLDLKINFYCLGLGLGHVVGVLGLRLGLGLPGLL